MFPKNRFFVHAVVSKKCARSNRAVISAGEYALNLLNTITMSLPRAMRPRLRRNASRATRFMRLRRTALPVFRLTLTPKRELGRLLKTQYKRPVACSSRFPRAMICENSSRVFIRHDAGNEKYATTSFRIARRKPSASCGLFACGAPKLFARRPSAFFRGNRVSACVSCCSVDMSVS